MSENSGEVSGQCREQRRAGDERACGVVVTGELMALRKRGQGDEAAGCDLFKRPTEGQLIKMSNGCKE